MKLHPFCSSLLPAFLSILFPLLCPAQVQIEIGTGDTSITWTNVGGSGSPAPEGSEGGGRDEAHLVDDSGISTVGGFYVHEVGDNNVASNVQQQTGGLLIGFGGVVEIGSMQIWALNDAGVFGNFSPATFDLYITTDSSAVTLSGGQLQVADLNKFTLISADVSLAEASHAAGYLGETYLFGANSAPSHISDQSGSAQLIGGSSLNASYIFFDDLTGSTAFGGRLGFSELQFYSASAVPEPSTYAALAGVGVLGLAVWRRRRVGAA